jgi:hypothetical protein
MLRHNGVERFPPFVAEMVHRCQGSYLSLSSQTNRVGELLKLRNGFFHELGGTVEVLLSRIRGGQVAVGLTLLVADAVCSSRVPVGRKGWL